MDLKKHFSLHKLREKSQNNYLTQGEMDNTKGLRKRFDNRSQNNYLTQGEMDNTIYDHWFFRTIVSK